MSVMLWKWEKNNLRIKKIYTDWANHYLEKAKHKRCITDLQVDITDGVLLADVIEAVTNEKVADIKTKPRTSLQMVENINNCLIFLDKIGVNVDGLNAKEIKDGNLKAILGLFFSLSRFKQQQKTQQQQHQQNQKQQQKQTTATTTRQAGRQAGQTIQHRASSTTNLNSGRNLNVNLNQGEMLSRLPSPFNKPSNKCPTVTHPSSKDTNTQAAAAPNLHKQKSSAGYGTAERTRQNNNSGQGSGGPGAAAKYNNTGREQSSSRSTSPSNCASGIPTPGGRTNFSRGQSVNEKHSNRIVNSTSTSSASSLASSTKSSSKKSSSSVSEKDKNSMLDKFKFFNSKEKSERSKSGSSSKSSKTHASSSKDESDRSHGDPGGTAGPGRPSNAASRLAASGEAVASGDTGSPKLAVKSLSRKSFGKGSKDKKELNREDVNSRRTPPPNAQNRISTASLSSVASSTVSSRKTSPPPSRRAASKADRSDQTGGKTGQGSPSSGKKTSKIAGLSKSGSKSSSKALSSQSTAGHTGPGPGAGSHLPTSSTGIPKLGTAGKIAAKTSKEREEARNRAAPPQKDYNKSLYGNQPRSSREAASADTSQHSLPASTRSAQKASYMAATVSSSSQSAHSVSSPTTLHPPLTATQVGASTNNNNSLQRSSLRSRHQDSAHEKMNNVTQAGGMASNDVDKNGNKTLAMSSRQDAQKAMAMGGGVYQHRSGASGMTAMRTEKRSVQKSDGNTQTNQSHLRNANTQQHQQSQQHQQQQQSDKKAAPVKEISNQSISSTDSANVSSATNESNNSNSNSNSNSHSSNDSVIFRPSSCDEVESGMESDANVRPFTDHISELRQKQKSQNNQNNQSSVNKNTNKSARKVETTFDAEVTTETHDVENSSKETTFTDDTGDTIDIKPMAPIMRSTQYSYLRSLSAAASPQKPFHIPGISVQHSHLANSASSRLGVNRPLIDPSKLYSASLKRTVSHCNNVLETDYGSDVEGYMSDIAGGYLSDGDMLRGSNYEDISSGYLSEGGASLYARRMQQRFREGMQAVKECMQKSSGLMDDDSFDDSSSISSGEISDTIAEISTDENLTGSSLSANSDHAVNPYGSLKRPPAKDTPNNLSGAALLAKTSNLLNSHKNINLDAGIPYESSHRGGPLSAVNWRGYASADEHGFTSDTADSDFLDSGSIDRNTYHKERNDLKGFRMQKTDGGTLGLGKKSNMSSSVGHGEGKKMLALPEDPRIRSLSSHDGREMQRPRSASPQPKKVDSEMNTDQSALLMRKMHGRASAGAGGYGLRRPLSNASTASTGSARSTNGVMRGVPSKLVRPAGLETGKNPIYENLSGLPRMKTSSASQTYPRSGTDMGPEAYGENTLESKRRGLSGTKTTSSTSPLEEYRSSTLGRRKPDANLRERLFGSRNSLNKVQTGSGEGQSQMINSTIISNPHATYGTKHDPSGRHFSSRSSTASDYSTQSAPHANYLSLDYAPSGRPLSGMSSATAPTSWLKCSSGGTSPIGNGPFHMRSMSETESMESIASSASSLIKQARAHGLVSRNILAHKDYVPIGIPRSNSIKSSQSERHYPTSSQTEDLPRTNSFSQITSPTQGPPSPTPSNSSHASSRFAFPMALSTSMGGSNTESMNSSSTYGYLPLSKLGSKDDDAHGSALSLVSSSSSVYSTSEDKHSHELDILRVIRAASIYAKNPNNEENIRKLRRELEAAQDKVATLTTQLSTNAHVVAAFEQSLSNMTSRLQHLTQTAERKDSELNDLRATIESLKQQSGHIQTFNPDSFSPAPGRRQTTPVRELPPTPGPEPPRMSRHMSNDSMSSINSVSSACSAASQQSSVTDSECGKKKNKQKSKNWLRSSFSKAFSRKTPKSKNGSMSDVEPDSTSLRSETGSVPNSPLLQAPHQMLNGPLKSSHSSHGLCEDSSVNELRQQLHEKDMKLTDIRLEALSSAHQLEQLRENMMRMKNEMNALKADNSRLQQMVTRGSPDGPQPSPITRASTDSLEKRLSLGESSNIDLLLNDTSDREGRRVTISVFLGSTNESEKLSESKLPDILIGSMAVSGKTKWDMLDSIVRRIFKEYVLRIDPVSNLGLNGESVFCYQIGEITRAKSSEFPELLPVGYLVGETMQVKLSLKGTSQNSVDSLSFEALIPKSIVQRYVSLLLEHRRIILCGPSGTGKTYLAQKLAEYLVLRSGKDLTAGSIATFNVDHKSSKELRQYLSNIADQCESTTAGELPSVIILDNLHYVASLGEVFNGFLSCKYQKCPYIIGTMNQATCSTTNLQLHHNFRWVLCANHMEPVKGFLGRYLRRKLIACEVSTGARNNDLNKIVDWMPKVWQHLNKFLETHSSSDVTIGPRLFLSCPMDVDGSQVWFTDLWNYSIVPYLLEAVREGLQLYGRRAAWEDPADWVLESYPWSKVTDRDWPSLLRLRPEDVGYETQGVPTGGTKAAQAAASDAEGDPLLNMLMRLQEAASYSSPQSQESDNTSLDSHGSGVQDSPSSASTSSSAGGVESTL